MRISLLILTVAIFVSCTADQKKAPNASNVSSAQPQAPQPVLNTSPQPAQSAAVDQKVVDEVKRIVGRVLGIDAKTIDANAPLSKLKVAADELDVVEIIMEIEESFSIGIRDDELGASEVSKVTNITVNELAELVDRKQKASTTTPK